MQAVNAKARITVNRQKSRKLHLTNKADQERHLQGRINGLRRLGQPVPPELQALADEARASKWRMFGLLMVTGTSMFLLFQLMQPRR